MAEFLIFVPLCLRGRNLKTTEAQRHKGSQKNIINIILCHL